MEKRELIGSISKTINGLKKKDFIEIIDKGILANAVEFVLPNTSKVFATNYTKIIFSKKEVRDKIIISHLFLENILNEIIKSEIKKFEKVIRFRFWQKIALLESLNIIKEDEAISLRIINKLRNNFAHNLRYNLLDFNVKAFPLFKEVKLQDFKIKKQREKYYSFLLSLGLWFTLISLQEEHKCINLMDYS